MNERVEMLTNLDLYIMACSCPGLSKGKNVHAIGQQSAGVMQALGARLEEELGGNIHTHHERSRTVGSKYFDRKSCKLQQKLELWKHVKRACVRLRSKYNPSRLSIIQYHTMT